jgi:hypothetical protein
MDMDIWREWEMGEVREICASTWRWTLWGAGGAMTVSGYEQNEKLAQARAEKVRAALTCALDTEAGA